MKFPHIAMLLVILAIAVGIPAVAQTATTIATPPPDHFIVTPGGVDMRTGQYIYSQTDVSVGPGSDGLAVVRSIVQPQLGHAAPFGNFSHNWEMMMSEKRVYMLQNDYRDLPGHPDSQVEIVSGGQRMTFRAQGSGGYSQVSGGIYGSLTVTGDRSTATAFYTLRTGDGNELVFRQIGSADCSTILRCAYVSQLTRADGTRLNFEYDSVGGTDGARLRSISSSRGYALIFEYNGRLITKACAINLAVTIKPASNICPNNAPSASYAYINSDGLTVVSSVTGPSGAIWGFTYSGMLMGFVRPGESTPWLTNTLGAWGDDDGNGWLIVTHQSFADGRTYNYQFDYGPEVDGHVSPIGGGTYTDNLNNTAEVRYEFTTAPHDPAEGRGNVGDGSPTSPTSPLVQQMSPGPTKIVDPLGRTTTFDYCDANAMAGLPPSWHDRCYLHALAVSSTDPRGIKTYYTNDDVAKVMLNSREVAVPGSGLADIVRSSTYNCTPTNFRFCPKPTSNTDARGNVTSYTYDAAHGGMLTQVGPADANGVQPVTRFQYTQQYAYLSTGSGYTAAATPIWLLSGSKTCRTTATSTPVSWTSTCGGGSADEVTTSYDYGPASGPNNLLLRGTAVTADGVTRRTCYGYDAQGNKVSETKPRAGLVACL